MTTNNTIIMITLINWLEEKEDIENKRYEVLSIFEQQNETQSTAEISTTTERLYGDSENFK